MAVLALTTLLPGCGGELAVPPTDVGEESTPANPYDQAVLALNGLALFARLDETSGTVAHDASPFARNGTISSSGVVYGQVDTLAGSGIEKGALRLKTGAVAFPTSAAFNLSTTSTKRWLVMLDVHVNATTGYPTLLSKGNRATNGWELFAAPATGSIGFKIDGVQYAWTGFPLSQTFQLAVSFDGVHLTFYVNGVELAQNSPLALAVTDAGALRVGGNGDITVAKLVIATAADSSSILGVYDALIGKAACVPKTCAALGFNCGTASDGCGGTLSCGSCAMPETCGGGGTANVCGGGNTTPMPVGLPGPWTMVFDDEFDGTSLDTTKWAPHWYSEGGQMNNVGTYEANVAVSGGNLVLTLASSTSGALINTESNKGFAVQVGMFAEARVYFPGDGTNVYNWDAWWISGNPWPNGGEHDIAEVLGGKLTENYHSPSGAHNHGTVPGYWGNAFHVYGIHRNASSADVYWDGTLVKSYPTDDDGAGEYLILNVGNNGVAAYGAASQMKVDYVRVWK
jgi:hypothetical protein